MNAEAFQAMILNKNFFLVRQTTVVHWKEKAFGLIHCYLYWIIIFNLSICVLDIIIKIIESRIESIIQISEFVEGKKAFVWITTVYAAKISKKEKLAKEQSNVFFLADFHIDLLKYEQYKAAN